MGASSTNPYTSQTISNYNASPPPDDGTQTVANQLSWSKHKTKLADPIKTLAEGINTAVSATFAKTINTDANVANQISGSLALEWATATIGTDSISPTYSAVLLGTESGATSDTLQVITATGVYNGALLNIRQRNATEEILLVHATSTAATATGANIYLQNKSQRRLDDINEAIDLRYDANTASGWVETGGAGLDANTFKGDQTITSGAVNTARATVASAATTADIWAADGNQIDWTGTTTCTGFPAAPQAGAERVLIIASATKFTAGANMLIDGIASGADLTCAANDIVIVRAVTTTQFRLTWHPYKGIGLNLIETVTASASASVQTATFPDTYDGFVILANDVLPATDSATLQAQLFTAGTIVTGANYYGHVSYPSSAAATYAGAAFAAATSIQMSPALDNDPLSTFDFELRLLGAQGSSRYNSVFWNGGIWDHIASTAYAVSGAGVSSGAPNPTGVKFFMSSGNITAGTFRVYGYRK